MSRLTIEYVLDGHQRGYNFTTPTDTVDEESLRVIWRTAMPRGQGWGNAAYSGARSIKCFTLPDDKVAVADVTVTAMTDESGRKGIRRAEIDVMNPRVFAHHLRSRLEGYPAHIIKTAAAHYDHASRAIPKLKKDQPLILSHDYHDAQSWWAMEALVLMLVADPPVRLRRPPQPPSFTTLALDYRAESHIVALPADRADAISDLPVLVI